ncbi:MAG: methyl-accepting chemotaxis protein [Bradymonadaceae bacterium]|nr:methyl-accepting chemotaxis protein [Lujinxingiaceae bacterium]
MMTLRTRLLLGYGYIMLLLLLTAGSSAVGFYQISNAIDQILSENFRSVAASVEMLESLERQNTLSIQALLEGRALTEELEGADANFARSLADARSNITLTGEAEIITSIETGYATYEQARDRITATRHAQPLVVFNAELFGPYTEVKESVFRLLNANHQAIIVADRDARETALHTAGWLGLLVTIALISMAVLARLLQREIISRLQELADVAEEILVGDHSRRFDMRQNDELGIVARQLNAALDARDELQAEMRGRINQEKQLVLGLMEEYADPCLLIGLDNKVIAATLVEQTEPHAEAVLAWLSEHRKELLEGFRLERKPLRTSCPLSDDFKAQIRLLTAEGRRPVGWLVKIESAT